MKLNLKLKSIHVLLVTFAFILFGVLVLPAESARSLEYGLNQSIDTSFFYTPTQLYQIIASYSRETRLLYIYQRFTFDLVFPIIYGSFVVVTIFYLTQNKKDKLNKLLRLFPILAVTFDLLENITVSLLMYLYPTTIIFVAFIASIFTTLKWLTLSFSFAIIFGLSVLSFVKFILNKLGR